MERCTDKENIPLKICINSQVNLWMISLKVKGNVYGKLKKLTMVTGTIIACMERESSHGLMGRNTQVRF